MFEARTWRGRCPSRYDLAAVGGSREARPILGRCLPDAMKLGHPGGLEVEQLAGQVGLENLAQAVAVGRMIGVGDEVMEPESLRRLRGYLIGRRLVGSWGGIAYIDDSKATNVAAAMASLERVDGEVVILLGGAGKVRITAGWLSASFGGARPVCWRKPSGSSHRRPPWSKTSHRLPKTR